ncbi:MAG: pentapeptide repeat-containing protein [Microcoleaceae cyanobacterium]
MKTVFRTLPIRLSKGILTAAVVTLVSFSSTPAHAGNPAHLKQLLETGACPGCDLSGVNLQGAHLIGADLREADLSRANLENANLEGADLKGATLKETNLAGTFLNGAELNDADLTLANLFEANLVQAQLAGAALTGANLQGASFIVLSIEETEQPQLSSAQTLEGNGLSISRNPKYLVFPVGGADFENSFRYTQDYLNEFFRPLNATPSERGNRPQIRIFPLGEGNGSSGAKSPGFIRF